MSAPDNPYSDAALDAAQECFMRPRCAAPGVRHVALCLDAAHDREALGLDASVHAASYRREVVEEVCLALAPLRQWSLAGGDNQIDKILREFEVPHDQ